MARIIYGALATAINGKVGGTVFQSNAYGFTIKNKANVTKPNSASQNNVKGAVVRCVQRWGNLLPEYQADWVTYASTFPQYAKHNPSAVLSGYDVFLKRNMISEITGGFPVDDPEISAVSNSIFAPTLEVDSPDLFLTFNGTPSPIGLDCFVWASSPAPANKPLRPNQTRLLLGFAFGSGSVNCADQYVNTFGRLPIVGEKVLIVFQNVGDVTGAVFAKQYVNVIVTSA